VEEFPRIPVENLNNIMESINQGLQTLILDKREQGNGSNEEDNWTRFHNSRREARCHDHEESPFAGIVIEEETTRAIRGIGEGTTQIRG
jgi:hypothetical protein